MIKKIRQQKVKRKFKKLLESLKCFSCCQHQRPILSFILFWYETYWDPKFFMNFGKGATMQFSFYQLTLNCVTDVKIDEWEIVVFFDLTAKNFSKPFLDFFFFSIKKNLI